MVDVITIPDAIPYVKYSVGGAASTGPFTVPFPITDGDTDLIVRVGGVNGYYLATPTDYTYTPDSDVYGGHPTGYITLIASIANTTIEIWRDIPVFRTSHYPTGPLVLEDLNSDLSRAEAQIQDARLKAAMIWHVGSGAPASSRGDLGDMYMDVSNSTAFYLYGPKTTNTTWGAAVGTLAGAGGGGGGGGAFSAGGGSSTFATLSFSDNAHASWTNTAGQVAALPLNASLFAASNTTQSSSGTQKISALTFAGAGAASVGVSNGSVVISAATQTNQTGALYALGNTTGQSSSSTFDARTLSLEGAGIVSVGWSNGSMRVSATQSNQAFSAAGGSSAFQTLGFSDNAHGSFTNTNGSVALAPLKASLFAVSNTTQSSSGTQNVSAISFAGAGAASVGVSNGSVVVSVAAGAQSNQTGGIYAVGNTTGQSSSSTYDARTLSVDGAGMISVGWSNSTLRISATQSNQTGAIYALGNTTGQSSSSTYDARTLSMEGAGIVSVGWSNGSMRVSATQSNQAFSAAGGSSAFQTLGFSDNAHLSWTNTNGSVAAAPINASLYAVSNTTQSSSGTQKISAISFAGAGGVSVGVTNGSVVISGGAGGGGFTGGVSNIGNTSGNTGTQTGQMVFAGGNNITLSVSTAAGGAQTITISAPNLGAGAMSVGVSTMGNTAGSTGATGTRLALVGTGPVSLSQSTDANGGTVSINAPATSSLSATGMASLSTNGSTISIGAGFTGYAVGNTTSNSSAALTASSVSFAGYGAVSVGVSNGSVMISAPNQTTTNQQYMPPWGWSGRATNSSLGQNTLYFMPFDVYESFYGSRINFHLYISVSCSTANSTGTCGQGLGFALYTADLTGANSTYISRLTSYSLTYLSMSQSSNTQFNATMLYSLSNSTSHSTTSWGSSAAGASNIYVSSINGGRVLPLPLAVSFTPGRYWLAVAVSTVAGNAMTNGVSVQMTSVGVQPEVRPLGVASGATNASVYRALPGWGSYSATSNAFPATVALSTDNIRPSVNQTLVHFDIVNQSVSSNVVP